MVVQLKGLEEERDGGAVATKQQFEFTVDDSIHEVFVTMKFDEDTDLPTIAEVLAQFATTITLKQGSRSVFSMSAVDLWKMMMLARPGGIAAHQTDGTGADNHVNSIVLPIPLGPIGVFNDIHEDYGLDPANGTIVLDLDIPADGNGLDERLYTVQYATVKGAHPKKIIERITRNITPSATGEDKIVELPDGPDVILHDFAAFQTTSLTAGSTTDAVGINDFSLEINQTESDLIDVYSLGIQSNLRNLSQAASSPAVPGTYMYWNGNQPHSNEHGIPLAKSARINFQADVAEAMRFFPGIERKIA